MRLKISANATENQRSNRYKLLEAAIKADLVNYGHEWWHFSYKDRVWTYVKGAKYASYGLAVNKDDPILSITKESYLAGIK